MPFVVDDLMGIISLGSALLSGLAGTETSDRETYAKKLIDEFDNNSSVFKNSSFTKDELFNQLLPQIQQSFRGAGDVAAGRAGSALGEQGLAQGGGFADAYVQAIAPQIAQGEQLAGGAMQDMIKLFATMDATKKSQLLQYLSAKSGAIEGLNDTTGLQDFITNFISGLFLE